MSNLKTIAFFGASGGCGLAALKEALQARHTCICLLRTPSKLADLGAASPNLIIREGNAHDTNAVASCLTVPGEHRLVDAISFSIGAVMDPKTRKFTDPDVCKRGIASVLEAISMLRLEKQRPGRPLIATVSTTGISDQKRDYPIALHPMYHYMLAVPHADKKVMEERLRSSGERFVLVRPSLLMDGNKGNATIKEGVEDVMSAVLESSAVGYAISRGAVGWWIYNRLLKMNEADVRHMEGKAISITW